jgi:hypothetical protein
MRSWVALATVGLVAGCVIRGKGEPEPEAQTGTVEISWRVGPSTCEVAGVSEVEVDIGGVGGTFACADEAATLTVPAGTYDLTLVGLDGAGDARFGGEATGVSVSGGSTTTVPTVTLGALPATVVVYWSFVNGQLCAANGVEEIEALLFDEDLVIQGELTAACNDATLTLEDIDAGTYTVDLSGRDTSGTEQFAGSATIEVDRGDTVEITVQLE